MCGSDKISHSNDMRIPVTVIQTAMAIRQKLKVRYASLRTIFSLNDPNWGRSNKPTGEADKPNGSQAERPQTPPDLDELWRDFNNKLNTILGRKRSGGTPPAGGKAGRGAGVLGLAIIGIWLASGLFMVQEGQAGVVLQFGKYKYTARPGINWRLPWPIQEQEIVNVSAVRSVEIGRPTLIKSANLKDSSMLTEDENIIDVKFAVQYRLKDATEYLFNNRDVESTVIQAAEAAVREIVGRSKMDFVLYEGREKIAIDLGQSIQKLLDSYGTGVLVTSVTMQNVQPPEQVQAAFDDAVKAGQDRERLKNEGQAYANDVIPRARGTAARLLEEAQGYKARLTLQAEGDAARFQQIETEYRKAPGVTRDRLYVETMQQIYQNTTKVLVESRQGNQLLYLPLDKLIAQSSTEGAAAPTPAASTTNTNIPTQGATGVTVPETASPSADIRSREGLRSRERESR